MSAPSLRLDKWLWQARFYKSRSLATKACQAPAMRINGSPVAKAHSLVREGDVLTFVWNGGIRVVQVLALGSRRGPAREAQTLYADLGGRSELKLLSGAAAEGSTGAESPSRS